MSQRENQQPEKPEKDTPKSDTPNSPLQPKPARLHRQLAIRRRHRNRYTGTAAKVAPAERKQPQKQQTVNTKLPTQGTAARECETDHPSRSDCAIAGATLLQTANNCETIPKEEDHATLIIQQLAWPQTIPRSSNQEYQPLCFQEYQPLWLEEYLASAQKSLILQPKSAAEKIYVPWYQLYLKAVRENNILEDSSEEEEDMALPLPGERGRKGGVLCIFHEHQKLP